MKYSSVLAIIFLVGYSAGQNKLGHSNQNVVYDSTYQVKIHNSLPDYFVHFHVAEGKNADGETACLFSIATYSSTSLTLVDSICFSKKDFDATDLRDIYSSDGQNEAKPQFADVNFDGYLDIRMVGSKNMKSDISYEYYLYNPKENKYQFSEEFTDVCNNAKIDFSKKQITITSITQRDCGYCWEESTYQVENNHPFLYQLVISELVTVDGKAKQKQTTKRMVKGAMTIVNVEFSDAVQN